MQNWKTNIMEYIELSDLSAPLVSKHDEHEMRAYSMAEETKCYKKSQNNQLNLYKKSNNKDLYTNSNPSFSQSKIFLLSSLKNA